jgi:Domain of unknown function (DUF6473)
MAFTFPGATALDYSTCRYGTSKVLFRGPRCDLSGDYVACLGGTETFGKFVPDPYPALVQGRLGTPMANLGCVNAGIDVFLNEPAIADVAAGAQVTVVQIVGVQNLSNRFYTVHPRRNDRFVHAAPGLKALYRDIDFTEFHFTRHLLGALARKSAERFEIIAEELRAAWISRMKMLLARVSSKTLLLWVANHPPLSRRHTDLLQHHDPLLVDTEMLAAIRPYATEYLQVIGSPMAQLNGLRGMAFAEFDRPAAAEVLGPAVHHEVAQAVAPVLRAMM